MLKMINPAPGETLVDIGCGTGESLMPFIKMGIEVTGIDPSPYMLDIAQKKLKNHADLHRGFAEDLPFDDNSFNHACLFTTLEFVENPRKAIEEACRVAKDSIFIGFLNRYAIKGIKRRVKGIFSETIYNKAQFFSIWEIKQLVKSIMGNAPLNWRTVCCLNLNSSRLAGKIENSTLIQRSPFGAFAGVVVTLLPTYRTKPITLKYKSKKSGSTVTGFAGSIKFKNRNQPNGSFSIRKTG